MEEPTSFTRAFSGWKIALAIIIGVTVSAWMLYSSLSVDQFVKCDGETGNYTWIDGNNNNKIDWNDSADFRKSRTGEYKLLTVSDSLNQINWSASSYFWIFVAVLLMVSRDFFYMVRIRLLTDNKLTWKAALYVILLWEFASALSPGVVGGAAVAMFILNRETIPFGKATAIVIITSFMDNLFFVVMIPLVFLFIQQGDLFPTDTNGSDALIWWFLGGFIIIFSLCVTLYLSLFWFPKMTTHILLFVFRLPFLKRWKIVALEWGKDVERAALEFKKESLLFWAKVFLATFLSWISRYLVINAILNAFLSIGFIDNIKILGKQLILWLFMLVSPTPGGSGVAEYAFGELLSTFSSSALLLAALAILWRIISYFPYLFIGAILLPAWIKRTR